MKYDTAVSFYENQLKKKYLFLLLSSVIKSKVKHHNNLNHSFLLWYKWNFYLTLVNTQFLIKMG